MFFVSNKINYYKNILQCNEFNNSIVNSGNCNTYDSQKLLNVTNYINLKHTDVDFCPIYFSQLYRNVSSKS